MIKTTDKKVYECSYCHQEFTSQKLAQKHNKLHDVVYVEFERQELKRLINFMQTGAVELLSQELISKLLRYSNMKAEDRVTPENYENQ